MKRPESRKFETVKITCNALRSLENCHRFVLTLTEDYSCRMGSDRNKLESNSTVVSENKSKAGATLVVVVFSCCRLFLSSNQTVEQNNRVTNDLNYSLLKFALLSIFFIFSLLFDNIFGPFPHKSAVSLNCEMNCRHSKVL